MFGFFFPSPPSLASQVSPQLLSASTCVDGVGAE